ncbi:MAG: TIGR01212 family radical SAM protein [Bilifractor sp.]|jgi:radical SAM protein (TIGR01212 family)
MKIRTISEELKKTYGVKVYKLSLSSGCTCPNRDGTLGTGGCSFCSAGGSGDFAAPFLPLEEQLRVARQRVDAKIPASVPEDRRRYIAYFQSYTNTYGDADRLRKLYTETIRRKEIVILSVGTRPDCLPPEQMEMLRELNRIKPVWVELGLQTIHERTAERIGRGYSFPVFEKAYRELTDAGITVIVHIILGLPGESREDMLETVRCLADLRPVLPGIKIQLLHILKGTRLAEEYERGAEDIHILTLGEYCSLVADCLELLPEETVIHRLTGDGPKRLLVEPKWSGDKKRVLNALNREIRTR